MGFSTLEDVVNTALGCAFLTVVNIHCHLLASVERYAVFDKMYQPFRSALSTVPTSVLFISLDILSFMEGMRWFRDQRVATILYAVCIAALLGCARYARMTSMANTCVTFSALFVLTHYAVVAYHLWDHAYFSAFVCISSAAMCYGIAVYQYSRMFE